MELRSKFNDPRAQHMAAPAARELPEKARRRLWMLALETLFFVPVILISYRYGPVVPVPAGWWPVLFALATIRLARSISFNEIGETLRAPFTEAKPDSCQAGMNIHPKGSGLQYVIGALISCPICTGTWAAMFLWAVWSALPWLGPNLVLIFGIAGASEGLHWAYCTLEWTGRRSRVISGQICPDQDEQ